MKLLRLAPLALMLLAACDDLIGVKAPPVCRSASDSLYQDGRKAGTFSVSVCQ